jgi:hypothetical protein
LLKNLIVFPGYTENESALHVLWSCPSASNVGENVQKSFVEGGNFLDVLESWLDRCPMEEIELSAVITHSIWLRRNTVVYGGMFAHPSI